jgi:hypothetical protein
VIGDLPVWRPIATTVERAQQAPQLLQSSRQAIV